MERGGPVVTRAARALLWIGCVAPSLAQAQSTLDRVRDRASAGEYAAARELAEAEPDALLRAQAEVWLFYRARDFRASLAAAERGLQARPGDPWLVERAAASAQRLRRGPLALTWARRLEVTVEGLGAEDAAPWTPTVEERLRDAQRLVALERRASRALQRAQWVALGALTAASGALLLLGRRAGRAPRRLPAA